ncbi:hypothetical protein PSA01_49760 [Pseudonocardia saturnea]|uniref:Uncharacterized protein n=1 Tax=Pseudonocardia saturnea TaxID=33909 RepID=A0ABQ0S4U6_9PSEU|nr:hypothetical protein Pdca_62730 [Pseudonocardia autotrophica]GEC27947.1 hypothetical protein PSA01_49760 [Pseudonocardia saturnea]
MTRQIPAPTTASTGTTHRAVSTGDSVTPVRLSPIPMEPTLGITDRGGECHPSRVCPSAVSRQAGSGSGDDACAQ